MKDSSSILLSKSLPKDPVSEVWQTSRTKDSVKESVKKPLVVACTTTKCPSLILLWQIFPTLHLTPQGNSILRDMSYRVSQLPWWVIWGELQGYGDPIHMDMGHVNRDGRHFPNPSPLFSPSSPPHPFIMVHSTRGGRKGGRGMDSIVTFGPLLHCSCSSHASAHLQLESNPTPISIFDSKYFFFVKIPDSLLVGLWIYSGERAIADRRWFGRVEKGHCREYGGQFLGNFASSSVQEKSQPDPLLGDLQEERARKSWGFYQSLG